MEKDVIIKQNCHCWVDYIFRIYVRRVSVF